MTRCLTIAAAFAALIALPGVRAGEREAPAPRASGEAFDVLYLSDARPVALRLRITSDGRPLAAAWGTFADALFTVLDKDKSGTLDEKELARLQPTLALLTGRSLPPLRVVPNPNMDRAAFAEHLKKNDLGPLRLPPAIANNPQQFRNSFRRGGMPTPEDLDKALLGLLDTNNDGKLSTAELTAAPAIIGKLDTDENETVGTDELLRRPGPLPFFVENVMVGNQPPSPGVELFPLVRKGADTTLARRLLARYGPKPKGDNTVARLGGGLRSPPAVAQSTARRLTRKELGLSEEAFAALDQDGDGELDTEELARFGNSAAVEVELAFRLGKHDKNARPVEVIAAGKAPVKTSAAPRGTEVAIEVPGVRLDLIPGSQFEAVPPAPAGEKPQSAFRMRYLNMFRNFDSDMNGYLDRTEANRSAVFRDLFPTLDTDGDGKLFEKELIAALDQLEPVAAAAGVGVVSVEVAEAGRGLLGLFDADGDGRLSVRELRGMAALVERFDANGDGAIFPGEVPRRFEATLARGITAVPNFAPQPVRFDGMNTRPRPQVGPVWFQKMDRNRDGDVSRREFLGTDADFRRLDTDGDGLISPQEAEAAGAGREAVRTSGR